MRRLSLRRVLPAFTLIFFISMAHSMAQGECAALDAATIAALGDACSTLEAGSACTEAEPDLTLGEGELSAPALLKLEVADGEISGLLVGGAAITEVAAGASQITLNASNSQGYNLNLRGGPGTDFDQVGVFTFDETAIADGRDGLGEWVRLQTDDGIAWIATRLITLDGNAETLPVVEGDASGLTQAITLVDESDCTETDAPSGLVLSYAGEGTSLQVNGVTLGLADALVLVQVEADTLSLTVMRGESTLTTDEATYTAETGDVLTLLETDTTDDDLPRYAFALVESLPLPLVTDEPLACVAGVTADMDEVVSLSRADETAAEAFALGAESHYPVLDQTGENSWWRIVDEGNQNGWVQPESVLAAGACDDLPEYSAVVQNAPAASDASPADVMLAYLQARVNSDAGRMQDLSCAAWDGQAMIQANSFRAMNASLDKVSCSTSSESGSSAVVTCTGVITTEYNNQTRDWALGSYSMVQEGGAWRMCGES